ncbi:adenylate/guanylate cyclase domain-containing protein [Planomicrobium okeanokoites]|uniref:adenylate/guanylate cyclase domain-containing protein n=1 Tax=Planomicrobium okeanokoites TaxID=244 RepID=UPI002490E383|nr:adenylate/guanylate cyclase domain-containing protein [Planomicrobium okeanokoites]
MKYATKRYVLERDYPFSKEKIWALLADNNRLNLYIGLFPVKFSNVKKEGEGVFHREAFAKVGGLVPLRWQEFPFQWEENKRYEVERRYLSGPIKHFVGGIELLDAAPNSTEVTRVRLTAEFVPQNILGLAAIPLTGYKSMLNTFAYIEEFIAGKSGDLFDPPQKKEKHTVDFAELDRLTTVLRNWPVTPQSVDLLHAYIVTKSDHDAAHMEPVRIAEAWGMETDEVLRLFLYAAKSGVLNLSWNMICPNCRVSKSEQNSLSGLTSQFHCDLCGINYDASFDQFVELNFSVHSSIRKAYAEVYCVGGPMITPHVKLQKVIAKGATVRLPVPGEENLRLRVLQANDMAAVERNAEATGLPLIYTDTGWSEPVVAGSSEITVQNASSHDILVALEQSDWSKNTVTAAQVTAMQEFRDLFSSEMLSPDQQIGIDHVTILFTDLQGSTSLYETVGDANAYGQVNKHFDYLTKSIGKNRGSVVKTIGDAVMAVFHLPEDGLRAALDIQQNLVEFNKGKEEPIILKVGLYSGPAIAVTSNDRLDYFGRTVNMAARIQGQGTGGDIIISRNYLDQPKLRAIVERGGNQVETFPAKLKGIEEQVELVRVCVGEAEFKEVLSVI